MPDDVLIGHCAPTLARIKTANLFSIRCDNASLAHMLTCWNGQLNSKGVYAVCLKNTPALKLIYIYRRSRLSEALSAPEIRRFLTQFGYDSGDIPSYLTHLSNRIEAAGGFPHEIGVFLDYPLEDVIGFIENCGENCKLCGVWKVYSDPLSAQRRFDLLGKCTRIYSELYRTGRKKLSDLTVAG